MGRVQALQALRVHSLLPHGAGAGPEGSQPALTHHSSSNVFHFGWMHYDLWIRLQVCAAEYNVTPAHTALGQGLGETVLVKFVGTAGNNRPSSMPDAFARELTA